MSKFVDVGPFTTHYLECGPADRPVLLLLHDGAWGGSAEASWGSMLADLTDDFRVLAPDLLGYGRTAKTVAFDRSSYDFRIEHISAFLTVIGVHQPVHAAGSSFGGSLLLRMAAHRDHASRLATITSISGSAGVGRIAATHLQMADWDGTSEAMTRVIDFLAPPYDGLDRQVALRMDVARQVGHYQALASRHVPVPEGVERASDGAWLDRLQGCSIPTLLIQGLDDILLETNWAGVVKQAMTDAQVEQLNARHCPNLDQPHAIAEVTRSFLKTRM